MLTIDTSAWIEWLKDGPHANALGDMLSGRRDRIVPTIVQLELFKWLLRERGEEEANRVLAYTAMCRVEPLTTRIAVRAADCCRNLGLASADAIVLATARECGAMLVTCDSHFEGLPDVILFDKRQPG